MNKNIVGIIIGVASLGLFFVAMSFVKPQTTYSAVNVSVEAIGAITESHLEARNSLTSSIKFNEQNLYFAEADNTWYYSIVDGRQKNFDPAIKLDNDQLKIAFSNATTLSYDSIAGNNKISFIVYDDHYYSQYQLVTTTLPIIQINHKDELSMNTDSDMSFELFDNRVEATRNVIKTEGKIHVHGALSSYLEKQSFRIDLRRQTLGNHNRRVEESLLGMEQSEDWLLISNFGDGDKIRNYFNSRLWTEAASDNIGLPNLSINSRYVEVIENGEYIGLYTLSSTPTADRLQLKKDANGAYSEFLFKKASHTQSENVIDAETLSTSAAVSGYELKSSEKVQEETAWNSLRNYLYNVYTAPNTDYINSSNDIQNLIDAMLFATTTQNTDELSNWFTIYNMYIAAIKSNNGYKYIYIPWDYDLTWGNEYNQDALGWAVQYSYAPNFTQDASKFPTGTLLKNDPYFANKVIERYKQLRQNHWSNENISRIIDDAEKSLYQSGAYYRERERWQDTSYNETRLQAFRTYVNKRFEYLDYIYGLRNDLPELIEDNPIYKSRISESINPITLEAMPIMQKEAEAEAKTEVKTEVEAEPQPTE